MDKRIYPAIVPGSRIMVNQTNEAYTVIHKKHIQMYEFVHHNYYKCVVKTEQQVADLINANQLTSVPDSKENVWAWIRNPAEIRNLKE